MTNATLISNCVALARSLSQVALLCARTDMPTEAARHRASVRVCMRAARQLKLDASR